MLTKIAVITPLLPTQPLGITPDTISPPSDITLDFITIRKEHNAKPAAEIASQPRISTEFISHT